MRERIVPKRLMTQHGMQYVLRVIAEPGGKHTGGCIQPNLTRVVCYTGDGSTRQFGFERAWIGADLEMHVQGFDSRFSEVNCWPVA